jgi:hypothetical protein
MPIMQVNLLGELHTVELDSDGSIVGIGTGAGLTVVSELPFALREALAAKVQIRRERVILPDNRPHTYFRGRIEGRDYSARTVAELCNTFAACAETTDCVENPLQAARYASAVLAADKGIPSRIESHNGRDYAVVTDEGKRFLFLQK